MKKKPRASAAKQGARRAWLISDAKSFGFHGFRWIHGFFCGSRCLGTAWFSLALMADRVLSVVFSSGAVCGSSGFSMWFAGFGAVGLWILFDEVFSDVKFPFLSCQEVGI